MSVWFTSAPAADSNCGSHVKPGGSIGLSCGADTTRAYCSKPLCKKHGQKMQKKWISIDCETLRWLVSNRCAKSGKKMQKSDCATDRSNQKQNAGHGRTRCEKWSEMQKSDLK
jgi:hypothetical protein